MYDESRSEADSSTTNDSYYEVRNRWRSAEDVRKVSVTKERERESVRDEWKKKKRDATTRQPSVNVSVSVRVCVSVCVNMGAAGSCHGMYRMYLLSSVIVYRRRTAAAGLGRTDQRGQEQHASSAPAAAHPGLPDQRAALAEWQHYDSRRRRWCCRHIDNNR